MYVWSYHNWEHSGPDSKVKTMEWKLRFWAFQRWFQIENRSIIKENGPILVLHYNRWSPGLPHPWINPWGSLRGRLFVGGTRIFWGSQRGGHELDTVWTSLKIVKRSLQYPWIILEFSWWNLVATLVPQTLDAYNRQNAISKTSGYNSVLSCSLLISHSKQIRFQLTKIKNMNFLSLHSLSRLPQSMSNHMLINANQYRSMWIKVQAMISNTSQYLSLPIFIGLYYTMQNFAL